MRQKRELFRAVYPAIARGIRTLLDPCVRACVRSMVSRIGRVRSPALRAAVRSTSKIPVFLAGYPIRKRFRVGVDAVVEQCCVVDPHRSAASAGDIRATRDELSHIERARQRSGGVERARPARFREVQNPLREVGDVDECTLVSPRLAAFDLVGAGRARRIVEPLTKSQGLVKPLRGGLACGRVAPCPRSA